MEQTTPSLWTRFLSLFRRGVPPLSAEEERQRQYDELLASRMRSEDYDALTQHLGYQFQNKQFLYDALAHRSFMNEFAGIVREDNEKLEFLGDSVLGLVISEFLYQRFPRFTEGDLSRVKSHVVSEPFLALLAREIELGTFLFLGKGEAASGGHEKSSLIADCFEAVIAAIYLDGGMEAAKGFLMRCFQEKIETLVEQQHILDHKSLFQEYAQQHFGATPRYKLQQIVGPEHDKTFEIELLLKKEVFSVGTGKSKKEAEQSAAKAALDKVNVYTGKY